MNKNKLFFIRYVSKTGRNHGLTCFGMELEQYINAILKRGDIVIGIEIYLE